MGRKRGEITCPWCGEAILVSKVMVGHNKSDYGTVIERRCTKCSKVLAAYLEQERDFLPRIRTF